MESEEKRLYDANLNQVPDYGSSSTDDRDTTQTDAPPSGLTSHQVKMRRRKEVAAPRNNRISVESSGDSWVSSDSVFCTGLAPPTGPKPWMTLQNAAHYLR